MQASRCLTGHDFYKFVLLLALQYPIGDDFCKFDLLLALQYPFCHDFCKICFTARIDGLVKYAA